MLADIRAILIPPPDEHGQPPELEGIGSADLVVRLAADPSSEWAEWGKSRKPITQKQLANMLRPFKIFVDKAYIGGVRMRGYLRCQFEEAWARYL